MNNILMCLALITTARDEEEYIAFTIESLLSQTLRPDLWIIVNDGSKDKTGEIIDNVNKQFKWIKSIHLKDRGYNLRGKGVINAFYAGFHWIKHLNPEFIGILDADVSVPKNYFAKLLHEFKKNPKLGISGGKICEFTKDHWQSPVHLPKNFVRGASKVYRLKCFQQINGLFRGRGWDSIDNIKAEMLGWDVYRCDQLVAKHHKQVGTKDGSIIDSYKVGRDAYFIGSYPFLAVLRVLRRMLVVKPYFISGLAMLIGYFGNKMMRRKQYPDKKLLSYVWQMHRQLLFKGFINW